MNLFDTFSYRRVLYFVTPNPNRIHRIFYVPIFLLLQIFISVNTVYPNNLCTDATLVGCGSSLENESTSGATDNGDIIGCALGVGVWYKIVGTGMVTSITVTPESNFDIGIRISKGTNCDNFTNSECVDNASSGGPESISFVSENAIEYYLYVGDFNNMGTTTGSFDVLVQCTSLPSNYTCAAATLLSCGSFMEYEVNIGSLDNGDITGCDLGTGVWYKFMGNGMVNTVIVTPDSGFDPALRITSSSNCSTFSLIDCVDNESDGTAETFSFTSITGTTYYLYVGDYDETGSTQGSFSLSFSCSALPSNYSCSSANILSCGINLIKLSTVGSMDNGDITGCNIGTGVWHKIIGTDEEFTVTAVPGAGFDIEMSVSKSNDCTNFSSILCSDQGGEGEEESATFTTKSGSDYYIYIGDYFSSGNEVGSYAISVTCNSISAPLNDYCSNATYMQCGDVENVNSLNASSESSVLCPIGNSTFNNSVWYSFTGTGSMLTFSTCASLDSYSQVIQLYTGDCNTGISCVNNTASTCSSNLPQLTFASIAGTEYYIMVGINGTGQGGQLSVELSCAACSSNGDLILTPPNNFENEDIYNFNTDYSITANNLIGPGAQISYNGKQGIFLNQNFEVSKGGTLEANVLGCP